MIHPSLLLRRALIADAAASGAMALAMTFGAAPLAALLNCRAAASRKRPVPDRLYCAACLDDLADVRCRGRWCCSSSSAMPRGRSAARLAARDDAVAEPARRSVRVGSGDRRRRLCGAAIHRAAPQRAPEARA